MVKNKVKNLQNKIKTIQENTIKTKKQNIYSNTTKFIVKNISVCCKGERFEMPNFLHQKRDKNVTNFSKGATKAKGFDLNI